MLRGVDLVEPGYAGGQVPDPTYDQVCTGKTGHAEVIRVEYDPDEISYEDLLIVFFYTHDPTTPDRQGNDTGSQYRSIILYLNEEQREIAEQLVQKLEDEGGYEDPVVTEIKKLEKFYSAEDYHREYYEKNESAPYCQVVIAPKIEKFKKRFEDLLKE